MTILAFPEYNWTLTGLYSTTEQKSSRTCLAESEPSRMGNWHCNPYNYVRRWIVITET